MDRRTFIRATGVGTAVAIGGCSDRDTDEENSSDEQRDDDGELRIAIRASMVRGSEPVSQWLKTEFEAVYPDVEVVWVVPEAGMELYVRQLQAEIEPDVDIYLGLTPSDLVAVDAALEGEAELFEPLDRGRLRSADRVRTESTFEDPNERTLPVATNYLAVVYDETVVDAPDTFVDLLEDEYGPSLFVPDARASQLGRSMLSWTVHALGEAAAFEYWEALADTAVQLRENWASAYYEEYANGEGTAIVGYSTAGAVASTNDWESSRHRPTFLDGGSYEEPEHVGIVADSPRTEVAYEFVDFVLSSEAQRAFTSHGGRYPAVEEAYVEPSERFIAHARRPIESGSFTYDELARGMDDWLDAWIEAVDE